MILFRAFLWCDVCPMPPAYFNGLAVRRTRPTKAEVQNMQKAAIGCGWEIAGDRHTCPACVGKRDAAAAA